MPATASARTPPPSSLRRANAVAGAAFGVGGSLFATGAALAQADVGGPRLAEAVYLVGGAFFSTGGYASVLLAINAPHRRRDGTWAGERWVWWAREPRNYDYLAALTLFVGTLAFAVSLIDAMLGHLTPAQEDRLVWNPGIVGCCLFLLAGHLAMVDIAGSWLRVRGEGLGWWVVFVNQGGSVLFMVAAVASFVRPEGNMLSVGIANWGTLLGALCFAIAGVMQLFEPPSG